MTVRAAIIGCGHVAGGYDEANPAKGCYTHAGAYRRCPEVELVAAADPNPVRRAAFGRSWDVPHLYPEAAALLRHHEVEIVSVCVPDALHEAVISEVLRTRPPKVIFAEKPLALTSQAASGLLRAASRSGGRLIVNNQRRWEPGHQRVRSLIRDGGIGDVVAVTALYVKGLYHLGCTVVDTIRFLVAEIRAVRVIGEAQEASVPGDPSVDAVLYLEHGATAVMLGADRRGTRYFVFELDILGTTGRVRITDNGGRITVFRVHGDPHDPDAADLREAVAEAIPSDMGAAIPNGVRQIVRFAAGAGGCLDSDAEEAYRDLCVLDAIAASRARHGARVEVTG